MSLLLRLETIIGLVLEREGYELVDIEYGPDGGRRILRLFLDKPGGVTLSDCEAVSSLVGAYLDQADIIPDKYFLEVSSPGLDRVLKKEDDFRRFAGRRVNLTLAEALDGRRRFSGVLLGCDEGTVVINTDEGEVRLPLHSVGKARLVADI